MHYLRALHWPCPLAHNLRRVSPSGALQIGAGGQTKSFQQKKPTLTPPGDNNALERVHTRRKAQVTLAAEKPGAPEHDKEGGVGIHTVLAAE